MNGSNWAATIWLAALTLCAAPGVEARGTLDLTRDLNTATAPPYKAGAGAARPVSLGGRLYFAGRDVEHGIELWTSDGTEEGTRLVADIRPGMSGSFPEQFIEVGGVVYFVADDGVHGEELWRTDGTEDGTRMVRDIMPGPTESDTWNLVELNGVLLFNSDDGEAASELWRSDGTRAGTRLVKDIWPGLEHGAPEKLTRVGDVVYFTAEDGVHGRELWVTDGTEDGTRRVTDINLGAADSIFTRRAHPIVQRDGEIFFSADDGVHGHELWKSDGTADGTMLVADVVPGADGSNALPMLEAGGKIYLSVFPSELWVSDGTEAGTRRISEDVQSRRGMVAAVGDRVFFISNPEQRASRGHQLWITDGTAEGTQLLIDVLTPVVCQPRHFIRDLFPFGDRVYFAARTTGGDEELWTSDGTPEGTQKVVDVVADGGCDPREFAALDGVLYYIANDQESGAELWRSDGTAAGTYLVRDNFAATDDFPLLNNELVAFRDQVLFTGVSGLHRSDGTADGTHVIPETESLVVSRDRVSKPAIVATEEFAVFWTEQGADAVLWRLDEPGGTPVRVDTLPNVERIGGVALGEDVIFAASGGAGGRLWRTDGSEVELLFDFTQPGYNIAERLFATSDLAFFTAADPDHSWEVWRTDGTPEGTFLTRDNNPQGPGVDFQHVNPRDDLIFFTGNDGRNGWELWRSDGTEAGTFMLKDIAPSFRSGLSTAPERALTASGRLYFIRSSVSDEDGNSLPNELWVSDGTSNGTRLITTLPASGSYHEPMPVVGEVAFFVLDADGHGRQFWRTDGTRLGTHPFSQKVRVDEYAAGRNAVYFTSRYSGEPYDGRLWATDGTASGTRPVARFEGDFTRLRAFTLTDADGRLFLMGDDGVHGYELIAASCGNGVREADEECDGGSANGTGSCSVVCESGSGSGKREFAPLKRRGDGPPPPVRRLVGGRTGGSFLPQR